MIKFIFISMMVFLVGCGSSSSNSGDDKGSVSNFSSVNDEQILINEILTGNIGITTDPDYNEFSDYIELYNKTNSSIRLDGLYLSDDSEKLNKWKFPDGVVIPAKSYLLIWADDKKKQKKSLHTNFKLSQKKGTVILSNGTNDNIYDYVNYKDVKSNIALKRDSGDGVLYMSPTPNATNSQTFSSQDSITVKSMKYYNVSNETYFKNNLLPVVNLSIDPLYLYDDYIGIYTIGKNGKLLEGCGYQDSVLKNYAQSWDRPAYFEYYDKSKDKLISIGLNISISGNCSRNNKKKSFSLKFNKKYGSKYIENVFYKDKDIEKIRDFRLRNSVEGGYLNDIIASAIVKKASLDVDYQDYQAVEVFVNGEYWGVYNIREKKGEDFIKSNYPDVKRSKLDIIKVGHYAKSGDMKEYNALKEKLKNYNYNLSGSAAYNDIASKVDINNFIDYMAVMIYSANDDWLAANHRCWRENKEGAKWRWMLDDLDIGFMNWNVDTQNFFEVAKGNDESGNTGLLMTQLFRSLITNDSFKTEFKSRFTHLLDTTFSPSSMRTIINELMSKREDAYLRPHKWTDEQNGIYEFGSQKDRLYDFVDQRAGIVRGQLNSL